MENKILELIAESRWTVPFEDSGFWRIGIYKPEFNSPNEITVLEKHSCPELFFCQKGRMGLIVGSPAEERIIELEPGQALLVSDYHNGFTLDQDGYFFIVERTEFITEFIDRKIGDSLK